MVLLGGLVEYFAWKRWALAFWLQRKFFFFLSWSLVASWQNSWVEFCVFLSWLLRASSCGHVWFHVLRIDSWRKFPPSSAWAEDVPLHGGCLLLSAVGVSSGSSGRPLQEIRFDSGLDYKIEWIVLLWQLFMCCFLNREDVVRVISVKAKRGVIYLKWFQMGWKGGINKVYGVVCRCIVTGMAFSFTGCGGFFFTRNSLLPVKNFLEPVKLICTFCREKAALGFFFTILYFSFTGSFLFKYCSKDFSP